MSYCRFLTGHYWFYLRWCANSYPKHYLNTVVQQYAGRQDCENRSSTLCETPSQESSTINRSDTGLKAVWPAAGL